MMPYKKYFFCIFLVFLVFHFDAHAQSSLSLGGNLDAGLKSFPKNGKLGSGVSIEYFGNTSKNAGIRISIGYDFFKQKFPGVNEMDKRDSIFKLGLNGYDLSLLSLRLGYQYFLIKNIYVYGDAGLAYLITNYNEWDHSKTLFSYAIGTAYRLTLTEKEFLQLSLSVNHIRLQKNMNRNFISVRVAYGLNFNSRLK